jgi:hypothetical protein
LHGFSFSLHGLENLSYRTTFVHSNILFRFLKNVSLVLIAYLFMTRISIAHIAWVFGLPGWYIKVQAYLLPSLILGIKNTVEAELGGGGGLSSSLHVSHFIQVSVIVTVVYRDLTSTLNHWPVAMYSPQWEIQSRFHYPVTQLQPLHIRLACHSDILSWPGCNVWNLKATIT